MQMKNFFNRTTNKHWQIEIDGQAIRTCLNGGKILRRKRKFSL